MYIVRMERKLASLKLEDLECQCRGGGKECQTKTHIGDTLAKVSAGTSRLWPGVGAVERSVL